LAPALILFGKIIFTGVYFVDTGELALLTTPSVNYRVFLLAPLSAASSLPAQNEVNLTELLGHPLVPPARSEAPQKSIPSPPSAAASGQAGRRHLTSAAIAAEEWGVLEDVSEDPAAGSSAPSSILTGTWTRFLSHMKGAVFSSLHDSVTDLLRAMAPNFAAALDSARRLSVAREGFVEEREEAQELLKEMRRLFPHLAPEEEEEKEEEEVLSVGQWLKRGVGAVVGDWVVRGRGGRQLAEVVTEELKVAPQEIVKAVDSRPIPPEVKTVIEQHLTKLRTTSSTTNSTNRSDTAAKKRAIPGESFKAVLTFPTTLQRFPIGGAGGLELVLASTEGSKKELSGVGGLGHESLSTSFKNFQHTNGLSHSWMGAAKCSFALHADVRGPEEHKGGKGDGKHEVVENSAEKSEKIEKGEKAPPALEAMRKLVAKVIERRNEQLTY
jgi:hypothetical protein